MLRRELHIRFIWFIIEYLMKKVYCVFLFPLIIVSCSGSASQSLTKEYVESLFRNPAENQEKLLEETLIGCVHIPARGFVQRLMVGFERTGESCSVIVGQNNTVTVSFISNESISLVSTSSRQRITDIFIGDLGEDQILVVQHHQGKVVSVTQTVYDENGYVVYGSSGKGTYIKECHLGMTTSERLAGRKSCEK